MPSIQIRRTPRHQEAPALTVRASIKGILLSTTKVINVLQRVCSRTAFAAISMKPIEIWAHWGTANLGKVCMILEALDLPYTLHCLEFSEVKTEQYLQLTPNGRLPTIQDPNTGLKLWEVSY